MNTKDRCPKCGEILDLKRGHECSLADNYVPETARPIGVQHERLVGAIRALLEHPFPHHLLSLRKAVHSDFDGDDEAARREMEEWCSQDLCDRELEAHIEARKEGSALVEEYCPKKKLTDAPR